MSQARELWERYCRYRIADRSAGFSLDVSRVRFDESFLERMAEPMKQALQAMQALETGEIANPDEQRRVGHYWLRNPNLAPSDEIGREIRQTIRSIETFARRVHGGDLSGEGGPFEHLLHIGIGGSALGPQLVSDALGGSSDRLDVRFLDNTDPDGIARTLAELEGQLGRTLVTVVSKSGSTPEPRNGMLAVQAAYREAGVSPAPHFVAITMQDSQLDRTAQSEGWLKRFPMWDWVGGRTSVTSAVGLVPAALQGLDFRGFLLGAAEMDRWTRKRDLRRNPAALLALMWYWVGNGKGAKDMVILPYKDRLLLLSRYLQQLVMESLGKQLDRKGVEVHQGIAVYGNKGSTDQHAYVQQLREGVPNFFATFVQVLEDGGPSLDVDRGATPGDYLCGFLLGTRRALYDNGRDSITLTVDSLSARSLGALIALYERAVGLYAELIDINAYHQPGVEAGKKAAAAVLDLQRLVVEELSPASGARTAMEIAAAIGQADEVETVFRILEHLAANNLRGVVQEDADSAAEVRFRAG